MGSLGRHLQWASREALFELRHLVLPRAWATSPVGITGSALRTSTLGSPEAAGDGVASTTETLAVGIGETELANSLARSSLPGICKGVPPPLGEGVSIAVWSADGAPPPSREILMARKAITGTPMRTTSATIASSAAGNFSPLGSRRRGSGWNFGGRAARK